MFPCDLRQEWNASNQDLRRASLSKNQFDDPQSIVVDPDSRLTQLGLVPVCADERYYFFESRTFGHRTAMSS